MLDIFISADLFTYTWSNGRELSVYVSVKKPDGSDTHRRFKDLTPCQYIRFMELAVKLYKQVRE